MTILALAAATARNSGPLTASADPTTANGFYDSESHFAEAGPVVVTPSGGLPPYTHSWAKVSGTSVAVFPSLTSDTVYFQAGAPFSAVYRDTVSDALGNTFPVDVTVIVP